MQHSDVRVGQNVYVSGGRFDGVWTVIKINPKNIKLAQGARKLNAHPSFMSLADGAAPAPVERPTYQHFVCGTVVTIANREGDWVVLRDNGNTYSVAKLGGDAGRYLRGVHVSFLTKKEI